jgi:hypothetical protein
MDDDNNYYIVEEEEEVGQAQEQQHNGEQNNDTQQEDSITLSAQRRQEETKTEEVQNETTNIIKALPTIAYIDHVESNTASESQNYPNDEKTEKQSSRRDSNLHGSSSSSNIQPGAVAVPGFSSSPSSGTIDNQDEQQANNGEDRNTTTTTTTTTNSETSQDSQRYSHPPPFSLDLLVAEEYHEPEEATIVSAELVIPVTNAQHEPSATPTAFQYVDIDGDDPPHPSHHHRPQNQNDIENFEIQQEQYHNRKLEEDKKFCGTSRITVYIVCFAVCLLVIGVIVGGVIVGAFIAVAAQYNDNTAVNTPTVTSSGGGGMTVYPYPCNNTTLDMFAAQSTQPQPSRIWLLRCVQILVLKLLHFVTHHMMILI